MEAILFADSRLEQDAVGLVLRLDVDSRVSLVAVFGLWTRARVSDGDKGQG